jgi:RNA polymerase sigma factor (sigma-70 family)
LESNVREVKFTHFPLKPLDEIKKIFDQNYASAKTELRRWGCNSVLFEDIYQEAVSGLIERQKNGDTEIRVPGTYLRQMCRNLWFRERKRQQKLDLTEDMDSFSYQEVEGNKWMSVLLRKHLKKLSPTCREMLVLFSFNYSEQRISELMNLPGTKAVNNKKQYCKDLLRDMIIVDPLFKEMNG